MSNKSSDNINEQLDNNKEVSKINDTSNSIITVESSQDSKKGVEMSIQDIYHLTKDFVKGKFH